MIAALPFIGWVAVITIAGVAGVSIYQIRLSVESVTEVLTDKDSVLNSFVFQAIAGAVVVYVATKFWKGSF